MRRANLISGALLAAFSLLMLFAVIPWQIDAGPQGMMSPRLVPNMMMIVVAGLAVLLVVNNLRAGTGEPEQDRAPPVSRAEFAALIRIGSVFALSTLAYLFVSPLAAGVALVAGALLALGERRPFVIVAMPVLLLLGLWLLFYKVLGTAIV